jgi:hypothetical protein
LLLEVAVAVALVQTTCIRVAVVLVDIVTHTEPLAEPEHPGAEEHVNPHCL